MSDDEKREDEEKELQDLLSSQPKEYRDFANKVIQMGSESDQSDSVRLLLGLLKRD